MLLPFLLATAQGPMVKLEATYTRGETRAMTVNAEGTRGFVADGATIAVLDLTTTQSVLYTPDPSDTDRVIQWIELSDVPLQPTLPLSTVTQENYDPDPTPVRLLLRSTDATHRTLFIAGGTGGLFGLKLDESLFASPPQLPCQRMS